MTKNTKPKAVWIDAETHRRVKVAASKTNTAIQQWVADACKKALREGK
jgi:predicted HicB family RNase H-like nuclease